MTKIIGYIAIHNIARGITRTSVNLNLKCIYNDNVSKYYRDVMALAVHVLVSENTFYNKMLLQ